MLLKMGLVKKTGESLLAPSLRSIMLGHGKKTDQEAGLHETHLLAPQSWTSQEEINKNKCEK